VSARSDSHEVEFGRSVARTFNCTDIGVQWIGIEALCVRNVSRCAGLGTKWYDAIVVALSKVVILNTWHTWAGPLVLITTSSTGSEVYMFRLAIDPGSRPL